MNYPQAKEMINQLVIISEKIDTLQLMQNTLQLMDIMSFGLGALCAIAFVIAANTKW